MTSSDVCKKIPLQTQMIEDSKDSKVEGEKEWYFGNADKERRGPYSFQEVCGTFLYSLQISDTFLYSL